MVASVPAGLWSQEPVPSPQPSAEAAIQGVVRGSGGSGMRALPGAVVEVEHEGAIRRTAAAADGSYRIAGLEGGEATVRVQSLGYRTGEVTVRVPSTGTLTLDLELEARPVAVAPLEIRGVPRVREVSRVRNDAGLRGALARELGRATPGMVEAGLAGALRELGRPPEDEPTSALLLRGNVSEGKLVLLDGSPVYAPFHVGGLVAGFEAEHLEGASLHLGGAPSRYDGGLSYILDLRTRTPGRDGIRAGGTVDGLGARVTGEGSLLPGTRVLVGGRTLHGAQPRLMGDGPTPYTYRELLVRGDTDLGGGHLLSTTGFRNREGVRLGGIRDRAEPALFTGEAPPSSARWGSSLLTTRYAGVWGGTAVEAGGAWSSYEARLPVRLAHPYLASARQTRERGTVDVAHPWGPGSVRFGGALERHGVSYTVAPMELGVASAPLDGQAAGWVAGGYVEGRRPLGEEFQGRVGIRADHFTRDGGVRFSPRFALTWRVAESASLTLAGGRSHQYRAETALDSEAELLRHAEESNWAPHLFVSSASQLVLSLDQELSPARLELDGFLKRFDGAEDHRIHTSGLELRAHREGERVSGWLGYSLNWVWAQEGLDPATDFQGRQLLNLGLEGRLLGRTHLGATLSYGAGLPVTSIPLEGTADPTMTSDGGILSGRTTVDRFQQTEGGGAPLAPAGLPDDFLRLDVELDWRGTVEIGGRDSELRPYVRVLNALNRRDAHFHLFEPWRTPEVRPLAERPFIPVLGLEWRF